MLNATRDLVLPTTITGSYPRPAWFTEGLRGRGFKDALGDSAFREQYFDAAACLMREQERAGLDIVSDGDARFDLTVGGRSWFFYPLERLRGITGHVDRTSAGGWGSLKPGHILYEVQEAWQPPILGERVEAGPLDYAALFKVAQRFSERPVKFGAISAQTLAKMLVNRHYPTERELIMDLADIFNAELRAVAAAGCRVIQVEEPRHHISGADGTASDADLQFFTDAINREIKGVETEMWLHTCWGNPNQQPLHWDPPLVRAGAAVSAADQRRRDHAGVRLDSWPRPAAAREIPDRQEDRHRRGQPHDGGGGAARGRRRPHPPRARVGAAGAAHPLHRLRLRPRGAGAPHRLLQVRGHQPGRQHRPARAEAARGADPGRRSALDVCRMRRSDALAPLVGLACGARRGWRSRSLSPSRRRPAPRIAPW